MTALTNGATGTGAVVGKPPVKEPAVWSAVTVQRALWGLRPGVGVAVARRPRDACGQAVKIEAARACQPEHRFVLEYSLSVAERAGQRNSVAGR